MYFTMIFLMSFFSFPYKAVVSFITNILSLLKQSRLIWGWDIDYLTESIIIVGIVTDEFTEVFICCFIIS